MPQNAPLVVMAVLSNCTDPSREKEFNEWYNNVHLADVLETPGIVSAVRYENNHPRAGEAKYLALYEFDTADTRQVMKNLSALMKKKTGQGRMIDCIQVVFANTFIKTFERSSLSGLPSPI